MNTFWGEKEKGTTPPMDTHCINTYVGVIKSQNISMYVCMHINMLPEEAV